MKMILRSVLIPMFCLISSTAFAQHKANEAKIYIPQNAIKMEAGKIIIGKNGTGFQVKEIHSSKQGFYIYKKDALIPKERTKGNHLYGCTACPRVFDTYDEAEVHTWEKHRGFADVRKIR
jgi:hypothetical protein